MELKTAIEILEYHQESRQGKRDDMIHEPSKLTEALDTVLQQVKKCDLADVGGSLPDDKKCCGRCIEGLDACIHDGE